MRKSVMVTGADRGLGLAIVKEFLANGYLVFAGRYLPDWKEIEEVQEKYPDVLHVISLDITDIQSVRAAYELVAKEVDTLDMLVNNAGIAGSAGDIFELQKPEYGNKIFNTNCLGALRMVHTFMPLLENGNGEKRLCFVSSESGCISVCHRSEGFIYPMSKTALNMAVRLLFEELYPKGFKFRLYHPGWVKSYMSGKKSVYGTFEPEDSAAPAVTFFSQDLLHEDVLRIVDNEFVAWPF